MGDGQGAPLLADPEQSGASPSSFLPPCTPTPLASENYGFGPVLQRRSGRLPFVLFCLLASVGIAVCLVFKQIQDTGVHLFVVTLTMVLALVLSQACYLVDELCHLRERHGGRCWPAVLLCLRFPPATYVSVGVLLLLSVLMALQHWDMVLGFLRDQWNLLLLMGLVFQLCTWEGPAADRAPHNQRLRQTMCAPLRCDKGPAVNTLTAEPSRIQKRDGPFIENY